MFKKYIQKAEIGWTYVSLDKEYLEIKNFLEDCLKSKLKNIQNLGYLTQDNPSKKELIQIQAAIHGKLAHGERDFKLYKSISLLAEVLKTQHSLELLETQGLEPAYKYMKNLIDSAEKTKVKAVKNLVQNLNFKSAFVFSAESIKFFIYL